MPESRLEAVEQQLRDLRRRVEGLEGSTATTPSVRPLQVTRAPAPPRRPAPSPVATKTRLEWEELVGGRVLGWLGSVAILLGLVFFFGMAISRGWIDEPTRVVLGLLGSASLLVVGVWLYERKGRTEAALAAVASAVSGLFTTLVVATQVYQLIPAEFGLACAGLVGAVAVAIAVRWSSVIVGSVGILGALLAPVMVGTDTSGSSLAFVAIALSAAVAVLLWQKWNWLSLGAFAVSTPQLLAWVGDHYASQLGLCLVVLAASWSLFVIAAIGYELRARTDAAIPVASWLLLFGNVVLVAGAGYFALYETGHPNAAVAWILGLAATHIGLGGYALRQPISREIGSLLIASGLGLSALGFADAIDGAALVASWSVLAVALAYLATRASKAATPYGSNADRLLAGSAVFLGLAFGHALVFEAPPTALFEGVEDLGKALSAIGTSAIAALICGLLWRRIRPDWAQVGEGVGAAAIVYLVSVLIIETAGVTVTGEPRQAGQVWLSAFWTVTGLSAMLYGLLRGVSRFRIGGLALLGLAIGKVYTYDLSELDEIARVLSFIGLGLLLLVGAFAYQRLQLGARREA